MRKFRIPYSVFRIPYSVFRIPYSVFRIPYSVFRIPRHHRLGHRQPAKHQLGRQQHRRGRLSRPVSRLFRRIDQPHPARCANRRRRERPGGQQSAGHHRCHCLGEHHRRKQGIRRNHVVVAIRWLRAIGSLFMQLPHRRRSSSRQVFHQLPQQPKCQPLRRRQQTYGGRLRPPLQKRH